MILGEVIICIISIDLITGSEILADVCELLSTCVNWMGLGIQLGLDYSRLRGIEIERHLNVSSCRIDMIAAWLMKEDQVMKKGGPTWKQLIQALKKIGEIRLSKEISLKITKQQKVSNPVGNEKKKSRIDLSTDEKRSVKKRKKEMKKRRKSSDTDSDNEERGDYKQTHRYKKRKIIYKESGSDSSDNDDEKEEMTSKVKRKRIESSFGSHESTNIKKSRLESSDVDERSVTSEVRGKGPASGKPYERKKVPKNTHDKFNTESEDDDSDSEPSSKRTHKR